jgi:hypothetical protein
MKSRATKCRLSGAREFHATCSPVWNTARPGRPCRRHDRKVAFARLRARRRGKARDSAPFAPLASCAAACRFSQKVCVMLAGEASAHRRIWFEENFFDTARVHMDGSDECMSCTSILQETTNACPLHQGWVRREYASERRVPPCNIPTGHDLISGTSNSRTIFALIELWVINRATLSGLSVRARAEPSEGPPPEFHQLRDAASDRDRARIATASRYGNRRLSQI